MWPEATALSTPGAVGRELSGDRVPEAGPGDVQFFQSQLTRKCVTLACAEVDCPLMEGETCLFGMSSTSPQDQAASDNGHCTAIRVLGMSIQPSGRCFGLAGSNSAESGQCC